MSAHTPGPWTRENAHACSHYIHAPNRRQLFFLGASSSMPREEHLANANLIAAAPDMLEVLEDILADAGTSGWWWGEKMVAAIAKAKGKIEQ